MKFSSASREANLHPAMCREAAEMLGQRDWGKHEEIPDSLEGRKYEHKKREEEDSRCEPASLLPMPWEAGLVVLPLFAGQLL